MRIIDDFLPADLYAQLKSVIAGAPFSFGAKSNSKTDPYGHWSWKPLHDNRHNLADLCGLFTSNPLTWAVAGAWKFLHGRQGGEPALIRCYVNAYTYGTDGYFHTDSGRKDETTAILYICDDWQADWAGETVLLRGSDLCGACLPRPNRLLLIPSDQLHAARAVSRKCPALRTVLVFKMRPRRSAQFEKLSTWLVQHGALQIDHQSGSLHDHLARVYQLLEDRKVAAHCAGGGGLHSIYGTNRFERQLMAPTPDRRAAVARAFGIEAERLAYTFSLLDRPQTLDEHQGFHASKESVFLRCSHDQHVAAPIAMYQDLCLIECANLADQNSLGKWKHLSKLWG